jgi:hypothetical protein
MKFKKKKFSDINCIIFQKGKRCCTAADHNLLVSVQLLLGKQ